MALSRRTVPCSTVPVGQPLASGTNGTPVTPGTVGTSGATTVALLENGDAGKKANEDVAAHVAPPLAPGADAIEERAGLAADRVAPVFLDVWARLCCQKPASVSEAEWRLALDDGGRDQASARLGAELHQLLPLNLAQRYWLLRLDGGNLVLDPAHDLQRLIPSPLKLASHLVGSTASYCRRA